MYLIIKLFTIDFVDLRVNVSLPLHFGFESQEIVFYFVFDLVEVFVLVDVPENLDTLILRNHSLELLIEYLLDL